MEKKNFKETLANVKTKAKNVWDKYKVQIIIGGAAVASTVAVVLLCKEDQSCNPVVDLDEIGGDPDKVTTITRSVIEGNGDATAWGERHDVDSVRELIMDKLREVNDTCIENEVTFDTCTTLGCEDFGQNSHYIGWEMRTDTGAYLDGTF